MLISCQREKRELEPSPMTTREIPAKPMISVEAGGRAQNANPAFSYDNNAYAMAQGQQLYTDFNCVGCHANGGGDIGPPLLDDKWIYGSKPDQIYASIMQGRPNGMPAFGERLSDSQGWQLVAYVRSLGGLASHNAAPGRDNHMKSAPPPNTTGPQTPHPSAPAQ